MGWAESVKIPIGWDGTGLLWMGLDKEWDERARNLPSSLSGNGVWHREKKGEKKARREFDWMKRILASNDSGGSRKWEKRCRPVG